MVKAKINFRGDQIRVLEVATDLGFTVSRTRGDHIKFSRPGCKSVFSSLTPGDIRTTKNCIAELRRNAAAAVA